MKVQKMRRIRVHVEIHEQHITVPDDNGSYFVVNDLPIGSTGYVIDEHPIGPELSALTVEQLTEHLKAACHAIARAAIQNRDGS